VQVNV
jgi:hypothetical protein